MNIQSQLTIWSAILFVLIGGVSSVLAFTGMPKTMVDQGTVETALAAVGSKATYTGATATTFGWVLSSEFGIAVGVLIGILGFLLNWYYSRKRDQREQAAHAVLMRFHKESEYRLLMKLQDATHGE